MKCEKAEDIFIDAEGEAADNFWDSAFVPLKTEGEGKFSSDDLQAFEQEAKPELKSRKDIIKEGIDRTPMLSVAEIRAKFNKAGGPVFPQQSTKTTRKATDMSPHATADSRQDSLAEPEKGLAPPTSEEHSPTQLTPRGAADLSLEEFHKIAEVHGVSEALAHFSSPVSVMIVIRPESGSEKLPHGILMKQMELQFAQEQRLLVMIRKSATRYIRLNDVVKVDVGSDCLRFLELDPLPDEFKARQPIALYFKTTTYPMVILLSSSEQRDQLLQLVVFLRNLLITSAPMNVKV